MLGVGREGVTEAVDICSEGLIHVQPRQITVLDVSSWKAWVCECYAVVKREYGRLLPEIAETRSQ